MGGFFGATSRRDVVLDVFFGVDYHSPLGTRRGGMAAVDEKKGFQRDIHNIENSPFRTKFAGITDEMQGNACIGCISDSDPQPMLIRSRLGTFAITTVGIVNNADALIEKYLFSGAHFDAMTGGRVNTTELVAALIDQKSSFADGIRFAQNAIEGTSNILILKDNGNIIVARDRLGRIPVQIGKNEDGYCASFEEFAFTKLGYETVCELGPGEIVELTPDSMVQLAAPGEEMRVCAFLWSYYGYPTSSYEGTNVEIMRYRNGQIMAKKDMEAGITEEHIAMQIKLGLAGVSEEKIRKVIIAYEPIWAIGTGRTATPEQAEEVCEHIRTVVRKLYSSKNARAISILYGGSMNEKNAFELLAQPDIDGGLIGGASLVPEKFVKIIEAANQPTV